MRDVNTSNTKEHFNFTFNNMAKNLYRAKLKACPEDLAETEKQICTCSNVFTFAVT